MPIEQVLILGSSTRGAAFSAARAGLEPVCADLFADADLIAHFSCLATDAARYPDSLVDAAFAHRVLPWFYTGAVENRPDIIAAISKRQPLWGNDAGVLERVRDPLVVAECLGRRGLSHPQVTLSPAGLPPDGTWLQKPRQGAGGRGIQEWAGANLSDSSRTRFYFQERISGVDCAAVFVANRRESVLIGVTRQLVGEMSFGAKPFRYCGSVGPMVMSHSLLRRVASVGDALVAEFQLVGLFGVDGIVRGEDFWPVEINPRYTASVEILEHALELPLIEWHRNACVQGLLPSEVERSGLMDPNAARRVIGKAILFAPASFVAPDLSTHLSQPMIGAGSRRWPIFRWSDVPRGGVAVREGGPILTVFAEAASIDECLGCLYGEAARAYRELGLIPPGSSLTRATPLTELD